MAGTGRCRRPGACQIGCQRGLEIGELVVEFDDDVDRCGGGGSDRVGYGQGTARCSVRSAVWMSRVSILRCSPAASSAALIFDRLNRAPLSGVGALDTGAHRNTERMKIAAADAILSVVADELTVDKVVPSPLDSYTGMDLNQAGIDFCRKTHHLPGLEFMHGDADNLPFADQSFEAVINIEASHCYPRLSHFLADVARVLRPGGHFLYVDARWRDQVPDWEAPLADAPMRMIAHEDISVQSLRGMENNSQLNRDLISRHVPALLRGVARDRAGARGGAI